MVLRGGSDAFIDEAERSLHDAIMIVRRATKNAAVVAGGGAIDMELSRPAPSAGLQQPFLPFWQHPSVNSPALHVSNNLDPGLCVPESACY